MKFSMTGQEKGVFKYRWLLNRGDCMVRFNCIYENKYKQWWSTIPSISIKWTITSHINSLNTEKIPQHMILEI